MANSWKTHSSGKNYFLGADLRVTAHLVQSSTPEIGKLFFLLRVADPERKEKKNQLRSIKQLVLFLERCLQVFMPFKLGTGDIKI